MKDRGEVRSRGEKGRGCSATGRVGSRDGQGREGAGRLGWLAAWMSERMGCSFYHGYMFVDSKMNEA